MHVSPCKSTYIQENTPKYILNPWKTDQDHHIYKSHCIEASKHAEIKYERSAAEAVDCKFTYVSMHVRKPGWDWAIVEPGQHP